MAKEQAAAFDKCITDIPTGTLVILTDFSMNYSHSHKEETAQEWCATLSLRAEPATNSDSQVVVVAVDAPAGDRVLQKR